MAWGVIIYSMQRFSLYLLASLTLGVFTSLPAFAQTEPQDRETPKDRGRTIIPSLPQLDFDPFEPQIEAPEPLDEGLEDDFAETIDEGEDIIPEGVTPQDKPDYSQLSDFAEREARLTDLFAKLKDEENPEDANLIAEEIWVIWLDSGSASINLVLRRGSDAVAKNQNKKARRMFDNVTALSPDYAEGWARSSRLALEEEDYSRALNEASRTLTLEPRHFYALWTLGNAFEQLGRQEEALEAYRAANVLYPELKAVKDRLAVLEAEVEGDVL